MSLRVKANTTASNKHNCNVSCVICHDAFVISGSDDGKIKVWNPQLQLISELETSGGVLSLAAHGNILHSCTTDEIIRSWDLNTFKPMGPITSTLFQPQKLFVDKSSGILWAGDCQGNVAKYENGEECGKYELVEEIWDIMVTNNPTLVYTARDRDVVICEVTAGTKGARVVIKSTLTGRSPLCIAGNRLCFLNREGRNVIIHENSLEKKFPPLSEIPASELIINAMAAASDNVIYTGGYDSTVRKWDLNGPKCLGSVNLNCCINAIASRSEDEVFVAGSNGSVSKVGA